MGGELYVAAHAVLAALYLALAWRQWRIMQADEEGARRGGASGLLPAVAALHALLLAVAMGVGTEFRFGFAHALSASLLLTVLIVWWQGRAAPMIGLHPIVLPAAAVAAMLPALFHGSVIAVPGGTTALRLHLLVAILAYSLLTIAALQALLMTALDRQLHGGARDARGGTLLRHVPPLLELESLLFRLIWAGFALLTATVVSGLLFSEHLFGRALRFEHKTVLALIAWAIFAGLLVGRVAFGWRGRIALRWTLWGFLALFLAYVGVRFVLEVVLHRV